MNIAGGRKSTSNGIDFHKNHSQSSSMARYPGQLSSPRFHFSPSCAICPRTSSNQDTMPLTTEIPSPELGGTIQKRSLAINGFAETCRAGSMACLQRNNWRTPLLVPSRSQWPSYGLGSTRWLTLTVTKPFKISHVSLLSSHNGPGNSGYASARRFTT